MTTAYQVGSRVRDRYGVTGKITGQTVTIGAAWVMFDGHTESTLRSWDELHPLVEPLPYGPVPRGERDEVQSRLYAASAALADAFAHVVKARRLDSTPQQRKACLVQAASEIAYVLRNAADAACALATEFVEKAVE